MTTSAIAASSGTAASGKTVGNRMADITSEEFIKVLMAGFTQQDPLKPQDSDKIIEQLSMLRNIESQGTLQATLKGLVAQNQIASAGNLIGKVVEGLDDDNDRISGVVTSVIVQKDKVVLELDNGRQLSMDRVTGITSAAAAGTGAV